MLLGNVAGSALFASNIGEYSSAYMGYMTLIAAVIAVMFFVVIQTHAAWITRALRRMITSIRTDSMRIFILRLMLLIRVRNLDNRMYELFGHNAEAIPVISAIYVCGALGAYLCWRKYV